MHRGNKELSYPVYCTATMTIAKWDLSLLSHLSRLLRILVTSRSIPLAYLAILILTAASEYFVYRLGTIIGEFYSSLSSRNLEQFKYVLLQSSLLCLAQSLFKSAKQFSTGWFLIAGRDRLTKVLHNIYLNPDTKPFYILSCPTLDSTTDNPDQRITEDINKFMAALRTLLDMLAITPALIIFYTIKTTESTSTIGAASVWVFFLVNSVICQLALAPLVPRIYIKEKMEGNFRFSHVRLRQYAEPIAMYHNATFWEMSILTSRLKDVINWGWKVVRIQFIVDFIAEFFAYFGSILTYLLIALVIFKDGSSFADKSPAETAQYISQSSFFMMYLINQFTRITGMGGAVAEFAGYTARIGNLLNQCKSLTRTSETHHQQPSRTIKLDNITLHPPNNPTRILFQNYTLEFHRGQHTFITGPNGSGKSALLRCIAGLWPLSKGRLLFPTQSCLSIFILCQTPYLVDDATIAEQILYPTQHLEITKDLADHLDSLLQKVGLGHLSVNSLTSTQFLSPGNVQRLMIARLLFHAPIFAFLDEPFTNVDAQGQTDLLKLIMDRGITVILIGHHKLPLLNEWRHILIKK